MTLSFWILDYGPGSGSVTSYSCISMSPSTENWVSFTWLKVGVKDGIRVRIEVRFRVQGPGSASGEISFDVVMCLFGFG